MRRVEQGYVAEGDILFRGDGVISGFKIYLDENQIISGIAGLFVESGRSHESSVYGNKTNIELRWEVQHNDTLTVISGSFSEQGYLG